MTRPAGLPIVAWTLALAAGCCAPAGAAPADDPATAPGDAAPARAAAAPVRNIGGPGDYGLRERLTKRLSRDADLGPAGLRVAMVNGGVVFSGTVPHWTARRRALVMAGAERGIVNVTDQMEIARGDVKDAAILEGMAGILEGLREPLGLKDLEIAVADGIATLSGTARDFAARVRAEESAGTILGATRIVNRLRPANIPQGGGDDDAVRRALARYLKDYREFPYPGEIQVQVRDGRARLEGRVALYLARQQAETMAALLDGVREVENRIVVDPSLQAPVVTVTEVP